MNSTKAGGEHPLVTHSRNYIAHKMIVEYLNQLWKTFADILLN